MVRAMERGHGGDGDGEDVRVEGGERHDAGVVRALVVAPQQLRGHVVSVRLEKGLELGCCFTFLCMGVNVGKILTPRLNIDINILPTHHCVEICDV